MKNIFFLASLFIVCGVSAQKSNKEIKGDRYFNMYSFDDAIAKYEASENLTTEGVRNLAESYKNTNQNAKSVETYAKLVTLDTSNPEDMFNYASILRQEGNYKESDRWMKKFQAAAPYDHRGNNFVTNANEMMKLKIDQGQFDITNLDINTDQQDFGPAFYGADKLVFASSREGTKAIKHEYNWNGKSYLNMYTSTINENQLENVVQLDKKINNKMHEGPVSFNKAGDFMVFTRNNYKGKSEDGIVTLQLFFATKENGKWSNEVPFNLNSSDYSVGHGSLNADGTVMYFSSDMPGGFGGVDLYKTEKGIDGEWGEAINLGSEINTEANEMFPFYQDKNNLLFFASNGHIGLGGLDIFYSNDNDGTFSSVTNVGAPMNTKSDDFSIIVDDNMKYGYFSSNREGGKGDDDIYYFDLNYAFETTNLISGIIINEDNREIQNVEVVLLDDNGKEIDKTKTSVDGKYSFKVKPDEKISLKFSKEKYKTVAIPVENAATERDRTVTLAKEEAFSVYSVIYDEASGSPVEGAQVTLKNTETNVSEDFITDEFGKFSKGCKDVKAGDLASYEIVVKKEGFITKTFQVEKTFAENGKLNLSEGNSFSLVKIEAGADLGKLIHVNAIYFDYNKFNIRSDAKVELDKIVAVMNEYPTMKIELGSHTDCRGKKSYNEWLSNERAKASANYIKSKITNPGRIYGKGYGESVPINHCECEGTRKVDCTEDEHQQNRRTEFKIISMGGANLKNNSPDSLGK